MGETSGDLSRLLVTTIPLDHAHHRVKPKLLNMNFTQVVVVVVVLMFVIVLIDRYGHMQHIGQLEKKQQDQEALIRKIQEDLQSLRDIVGGGGPLASYDTTEAEEQLQKTTILNERQSQSYSVTRHNQATVSDDGEGNQLSGERRTDVKGDEYLKRVKRPAADPPPSGGSNEETPTRQKRKGSKKERKKKTVKKCRQDNSTCGTPTCEFVHECNEARHGGRSHFNHFVAHFEQPSDSNQLIDEVIGNWKYASWTLEEHEHKLRIKSRLEDFPDRPRKSTIEVRETGIYYIYSQITFADESSYLGHSIMIDNEIKFSCSLWVTDVQANTCTTGGLVKIEAHQLVHIQLIENNRIINMDDENTFFGIIHVMSLP